MACWFIFSDPCGLACYLFGWATILYVNYTLTTEVLWPWLGGHWSGLFHIVGFQILIGLICGSYYRAATTDPGSVERYTASKNDVYAPEDDPQRLYKPRRRFCEKCECIKPPRAHHCSTCKRCINKMDHHCPWVNNCVGSNNLKFFLLFLFYTFWGGVYSALMFIVRFLLCWRASPGSVDSCKEPSVYTIISCVVSCVLAIFFAIFTAAMAWDQWEGMVTNTTGIESMKGWAEEEMPLMHSMIEVFGEPFGWRWFAPLPLHQTGGLTGYYAWSPSDDPDGYDVRDPAIGKHFRRIESYLAEQAQHQTEAEAENARRTAVQAAAEIHRRHAIKKRPFWTLFSKQQLKQIESQPKVNAALPFPIAPAKMSVATTASGTGAQPAAGSKESSATPTAEKKVNDVADGGKFRGKEREKMIAKGVSKITQKEGSDAGLAAAMLVDSASQ